MPVGSIKESEHIGFIGAKVSHGSSSDLSANPPEAHKIQQ